MHWKICKEFGIEVKERWYEHEPKTVTENESVTILWDMPIHTDRTTAANRTDIVLTNKKDKTCLPTDIFYIYPTTSAPQLKPRKSLPNTKKEIEVERTWGLKATAVLVVMGALGTIKEDMENRVPQQNPWQHKHTTTP